MSNGWIWLTICVCVFLLAVKDDEIPTVAPVTPYGPTPEFTLTLPVAEVREWISSHFIKCFYLY